MTEQEVDRRCAIYGTLLGIFVAAVIVALFWWVVETATAQTDGSAEPTCIGVHESDLPGAFPHTAFTDCIQGAETWHDARLINTHPPTFRHFVWVSGPEACIFNVDIDANHHWQNPQGGRDCAPGVNSGHCGYWSMGWNIVVASGQSCSAYGVPPCAGGFCQ